MSKKTASTKNDRSPWVDAAAGAVRTAFGLVWAIDAYLKIQARLPQWLFRHHSGRRLRPASMARSLV